MGGREGGREGGEDRVGVVLSLLFLSGGGYGREGGREGGKEGQ